jgi:capsular polysaccharide biosynthesis protein
MSTPAEDVSSRPFPMSGIRRRWRLILATAVVGLLLGLLLALLLPVKYSSTVSLVVEPSLGNAFSPTETGQSLDNLTTEVVVAGSAPVAEKVREDVDTHLSAKTLRKNVSVDKLPNSQVIEISYTAASADEARKIADAFADAYLQYRQEISTGATKNLLTGLETSAASARTTIDQAVRALATSQPGTRAYELAQSRIRSGSATLTELETQADQVRFSRTEPGRVLSPANKPRDASNLPTFLAGGLLAGLLAGLAIAVRQALRDDRIHTVADLDVIGPPVLSSGSMRGLRSSTTRSQAARVLSASFRGRLGPDRSAVVLTAVGPGVDTVRGALALVEALRADSVEAALVELAAEAPDRQPQFAGAVEADGARVGYDLGSDRGADASDADEHTGTDTDVPLYRIRGDRLDAAQFRELLARLGARHELVVVVGRVLSDPATLDAVEAVGDTMLVVPMGRYGENAVKSAVDQVRLFHGRVVALIVG